MKKFAQILFLAACVISLGVAAYFFVQNRSAANDANRPATSQKILSDGTQDSSSDDSGGRTEKDVQTSHIPPLEDEVFLDVSSVNLDTDDDDEQIITIRKKDETRSARLCIAVADYVAAKHSWQRVWEGETLTTKFSTFQIQTMDLIGDHNLDIICTGMDDQNNQTLSAFRRIPSTDGSLKYAPVASMAADSVSIEATERTEGYQLGQTNGSSWDIAAYSQDKESSNLLDQIKIRYSWDPSHEYYVEKERQKVPGAQVEREAAARVLTGKEKDFEDFLQGAWYESGKNPTDPATRILVFDRAGNSIVFYSSDAQEDYTWQDSHSTRHGIYVGCQNESVTSLYRQMDIELSGSDRISVHVFEDLKMRVDTEGRWDGSYQKMPLNVARPGISNDSSREMASAILDLPFQLAGTYRANDSTSYHFENQRFTHTGKNIDETGGFSLYKIGSDIVCDLTLLTSSGAIAGRRTYKATLLPPRDPKAKDSTKRILLSPARISIAGLELLESGDITLEQR